MAKFLSKFKDFLNQESVENLNEKMIVVGNNQKYGQIVFLAGGAGSGKGFAIRKFINHSIFKIRDVDEFKLSFLKLAKKKNKYPEIKDLNLKNPNDVAKLHMWVKKKGIKDKTLNNLLLDKPIDRLPNILFDTTMADIDDVTKYIPMLLGVGYKPENIHIIWVLTDYAVAVKRNRERERIVPDDIMLSTHDGASRTMYKIVNGAKPKEVQGGIYVILNNTTETVPWVDQNGNVIKNSKGEIGAIKSFTYITIKKPKKEQLDLDTIKNQLYVWMRDNAPKTIKNDLFK